MNLSRTLPLALIALVLVACGGGGSSEPAPAAQIASFVHYTQPANTVGALSTIHHPVTDGNPDAYVFVTPVWVAADMVYVNMNVSVRYLGANWCIQSANGVDALPMGATFHVTLATDGDAGNTHFGVLDAVADHVLDSRAFLDHPAANGNPGAILLLTQNATPRGAMGPDFDVPLSVVYVPGEGRWAVYNRSAAAIPDGLALNYAIVGTNDRSPFQRAVVHTVTSGSRDGPSSYPDLPDGPGAVVHLTQVVHGGLMSTVQNAVVYHTRGWGVLPQDASLINLGLAFNMVVVR